METLRLKLLQGLERLSKDRDAWEVLKGSAITFLLRVCSFLLIYLINFFIARVYGPEELGIYSLALTILNITVVLVALGTDTAIVRWIAEYITQNAIHVAKRILSKIIRLTLFISIICSIIFFLYAEQFAMALFEEKRMVEPIKIVACLLPLALLSRLYAASFRGLKNVKQSITYDVLGPRLGSFVFLIMLVHFFPGNDLYPMYAFALATVINTIFAAKDWQKEMRQWEEQDAVIHEGSQSQATGHRQILSVSLPMFLTSSMVLVLDWTDTIMLGIFSGMESVGEYSVVLRLALITSFALTSVNTIILPKFSEMYWSNNTAGLRRVIGFANRLAFWTSVPFILLVALFSEQLLSLFGRQFSVGTASLIILCFGQCVNSATGNVISLLNMTGHQKKSRNILMGSALMNIVGNMLLIPSLGIMGAAISTTASIIVRDVCATYCANQIFGFSTWYVPFFSNLKKEQQSNQVGGHHNGG